jgi:hypothetical protein
VVGTFPLPNPYPSHHPAPAPVPDSHPAISVERILAIDLSLALASSVFGSNRQSTILKFLDDDEEAGAGAE